MANRSLRGITSAMASPQAQTGERMNRVSLVCTVHDEAGHANVAELCAILESIQPEVIFLEVPPEAFNNYCENSQKLEAKAVRQYRVAHQVEPVPVDLPTPEREFFESHEQLHSTSRETSSQYRQLLRLETDRVKAYGYAFLNSEYYCELRSEIDQEMFSTIGKIGDSRLTEIQESWNRTNDLREKEMIANILRYCRGNTFDRAVFFIGAAHRQAIIEKAREQTAAVSTNIQWDFDDWMSQVTRVSDG
jgi:hypothetical protein